MSAIDHEGLCFFVDRDCLLQSLVHIAGVVEKRNVIPVLSAVKIDVLGEKAQLTATDTEITIISSIKVHAVNPGTTTVVAHVLLDIVRKLSTGFEIEFRVDSLAKVQITCDRAKFSIPLIDPSGFPAVTAEDFDHDFTLSGGSLLDLITKTKFAMSTEDSRYYLNGLHFHTKDDHLYVVATDGNRLAYNRVLLSSKSDFALTVPKKTVIEVHKMLDDRETTVHISVASRRIKFVFGSYVIISKLIDSAFPNYEEVIPRNNDKIMKVDAQSLASVIDRVSVIVADKVRGVCFTLQADELNIEAFASNSSNSEESIAVDYRGDVSFKVSLNAKYLLDALSVMKGCCEFSLSNPNAAITMKDASSTDSLYVIMPMRM